MFKKKFKILYTLVIIFPLVQICTTVRLTYHQKESMGRNIKFMIDDSWARYMSVRSNMDSEWLKYHQKESMSLYRKFLIDDSWA